MNLCNTKDVKIMKFTKMHGAGNDYIFIDTITYGTIDNPNEMSVKVSDRHFGVGADGLILILKSDIADYKMRIFNADGSEAEMCGNGIRSFAAYVYNHGLTQKQNLEIETLAGVLDVQLHIENGICSQTTINMGKPIFTAKLVPAIMNDKDVVLLERVKVLDRELKINAVSMGNPHCVIFVDDDINKINIEQYAVELQNSTIFPEGVNVEFVNIKSLNEVYQRTYERGSGETLACGTGASAVLAAGYRNRMLDRRIVNHLKGGVLILEQIDTNIYMTGPAVEVFSGEWKL